MLTRDIRDHFWIDVRGLLIISLVVVLGCQDVIAQDESDDAASIELPRGVHFRTPDGAVMLVPQGSYSVSVRDGAIVVVAGDDKYVIAAEEILHAEYLLGAEVVSEAGSEENVDLHTIVVLLPDGVALVAEGSYSGITSRGVLTKASQMRKNKVVVNAAKKTRQRLCERAMRQTNARNRDRWLKRPRASKRQRPNPEVLAKTIEELVNERPELFKQARDLADLLAKQHLSEVKQLALAPICQPNGRAKAYAIYDRLVALQTAEVRTRGVRGDSHSVSIGLVGAGGAVTFAEGGLGVVGRKNPDEKEYYGFFSNVTQTDVGVAGGVQVGFWKRDPRDLSGPVYSAVLGGSAEVGALSGIPTFVGAHVMFYFDGDVIDSATGVRELRGMYKGFVITVWGSLSMSPVEIGSGWGGVAIL